MPELGLFALLVFYLVPFLVACARDHDFAMGVLAVNVLFGWTGIGWLVALAAALAPGANGASPESASNTSSYSYARVGSTSP